MNKTTTSQFPQIYRFFTAGGVFLKNFSLQIRQFFHLKINRIGLGKRNLMVRAFPPFFLMLYLLFSVFYPLNNYDKAKLAVLYSPNSAKNHYELGVSFWQKNNLEEAKKEFLVAQKLSPFSSQINDSLEAIQNQISQPEKLRKTYSYWEKVVQEKNNYRDAFLIEADLAYQLKNLYLARKNIHLALELDPNFPIANEFANLIKTKK
jgi:tetratricopeptide (TPR) repeat protein